VTQVLGHPKFQESHRRRTETNVVEREFFFTKVANLKSTRSQPITGNIFNFLAPDFFLILAHTVYKM